MIEQAKNGWWSRRGPCRASVQGALALVLSLPTAPAGAEFLFGYTGIAGASGSVLAQTKSEQIATNVAMVDFSDVWTTTDLASVTAEMRSSGVKAGLFLDYVLFRRFPVASSACADHAGPFIWALRANWKSRLDNFAAANGAYVTPETTAFLVVFAEVNNGCVALEQVEIAAQRVETLLPGIPTAMGYGRSPGAKPAPEAFPPAIDLIAFFKYGIYDPADPDHPYNADREYLFEFGLLKERLWPHQSVLLVPDAFWADFLHGNLPSRLGPGAGWPRWYLGPVALRYERFAVSEPRVVGLILFTWGSPSPPGFVGTGGLPPEVRAAHREIGCRIVGC